MKRAPAAALARIMSGALLRRRMSPEHAAYVVDGLIEASLRGIDTHGVRLFPTYVAELDGGRSRARPEMHWLGGAGESGEARGPAESVAPAERVGSAQPRAATAVRVLDAGHALGMVAGRIATAEAIRLGRELGTGVVVVRNSNHFGPASCYTLEMARHEMVGFACTNSDALVAPCDGLLPLFGTNPLSLAAAARDGDLFCADLATSQVSYSRLKRQRDLGAPIPAGWAVGGNSGESTAAAAGELAAGSAVTALLPLGGHKGQCLAMAIEILCSLLAGAPFDHQLSHFYDPPFDAPRRVSHLFLALDVAAFGAPSEFRARLSELNATVRGQPAQPGRRVRVPGDPEAEAAAERRTAGIPMTDEDWEQLEALDREPAAGVP